MLACWPRGVCVCVCVCVCVRAHGRVHAHTRACTCLCVFSLHIVMGFIKISSHSHKRIIYLCMS